MTFFYWISGRPPTQSRRLSARGFLLLSRKAFPIMGPGSSPFGAVVFLGFRTPLLLDYYPPPSTPTLQPFLYMNGRTLDLGRTNSVKPPCASLGRSDSPFGQGLTPSVKLHGSPPAQVFPRLLFVFPKIVWEAKPVLVPFFAPSRILLLPKWLRGFVSGRDLRLGTM